MGTRTRVGQTRRRAGNRTVGILLTTALVAIGLLAAATAPAGAVSPTPTPVGTDVVVVPEDTTTTNTPVEIHFGGVLVAGETSLTTTTEFAEYPALPVNFWAGSTPTYYELSTTATLDANLPSTICFSYGSVADEDRLMAYEWVGGGWALRNVANRDTALDTLCIEQPFVLQSPSIFVLGSPDPVAVDDTATGSEVDPVEIDVLANDLDPAGHALALTVWSSPSHGIASVNEAGDRIIYTANLYTCGPDSFVYQLADSIGNTAYATVNVDVPCIDAPPRAYDDTFTIPQDSGPYIFDPTVNDLDDDPLAPSNLVFEFFDPGTGPSAPAHGIATIDAAGPGAHQITYTPDPGFCGDDWFILKATDGSGIAENYDLPAVTFHVQCPDTTPPGLVRVTLNPSSIDTTANDAQVEAYIRFADAGDGFGNGVAGSVTFHSPSGTASVSSTLVFGGYGGPNEYDFYGTLTVPQGSEVGTWVIDSIEITDLAGNAASFSALDAQLTGTDYSFVNVTPTAPVDDYDGIPAAVEDAGRNGGDGNFDGVLDSWQPHVASFPNAKTGQYVTIVSENGTTIQNVTTAVGPPDGSVSSNIVYPVGLIGYEVHGLHSTYAYVQFMLPPGVSAVQVQKVDASDAITTVPQWGGDDGFVMNTGNTVAVFLHDGGAFDADASENGVLVDPVLLGRVNNAPGVSVGPNPLVTNPGVTKTVSMFAFDQDFGDTLTTTIGTAAHGTVLQAPLRYVADPTYLGDDSFTVSVSDGYVTTTVTVIVHVVVPPTITCNPIVLNIPANGSVRFLSSPLMGAVQGACISSDGSFVSTSFPFGMQHGTFTGAEYRPFKDFVGQDVLYSNTSTGSGGSGLLTVVINVIGATASASQGNPGDPFTVSFYCKGLATVSITKPGPVVVGTGAKSATGAVSFDFTVPAEVAGTALTIKAICNNAYAGYAGGNGYNGYNSFAWANLPALTFTVTEPFDGDGVSEPPGYDGNGDGTPDSAQPDVTSVEAPTGAGVVTIVAPDEEYALTAVTVTVPDDLPAGVEAPIGVIGFTVDLPADVTTADVVLLIPEDVTIDTVLKDLNGTIIDFTTHATIDLANHKVTLHLVDGGDGDADGVQDGDIEDPIILQSSYGFGGFGAPLGTGVTNANSGQTIPVTWRVTTASGAPVSDPASFVKLTSRLCDEPVTSETRIDTPGASSLKYKGDGVWQINWKTDKAWNGQCRTLTLYLADDVGNRTAMVQFTK